MDICKWCGATGHDFIEGWDLTADVEIRTCYDCMAKMEFMTVKAMEAEAKVGQH